MPSAGQVEKDGLNLGEINKLLVKKVEELTLYLIEKDKQLQEQVLINKEMAVDAKEQKLINKKLSDRLNALESIIKNKKISHE